MKKLFPLFIAIVGSFMYLPACFSSDSSVVEEDRNAQALTFCQEQGLNTDFYIFVDMDIHSGKNRMFVYDLQKDSLLAAGLCSHGCGKNPWSYDFSKENPTFSNVVDSHQSSLGKYKIGKRGYSNFGIHVNYRLHGLESTNDKSYERDIMLHSWDVIENEEVYPAGCPEGWGCPAVSNEMMTFLDDLLKQADGAVLLWIDRTEAS